MKNKPTITELLNFLDKASIELQLAWEIPHLYDKSVFRVQWIHNNGSVVNFFLQQIDQSDWYNLTNEQLIELLVEKKADLLNFEFQLLKTIAVQTACSHYYVQKANQLIGESKVKSIIDMTNQIIESDKDPLKLKSKLKLKLVDQEEST